MGIEFCLESEFCVSDTLHFLLCFAAINPIIAVANVGNGLSI